MVIHRVFLSPAEGELRIRLSDLVTDPLIFSALESFHNMANTQDSAQTQRHGSPYLNDDGTVPYSFFLR